MPRQRLFRDARGVVYLEFLVAFFPFFLLVVGTAQLALLAQADLVVRHAVGRAVRKAVTVIDDDPSAYDGAARLFVRDDAPAERGSHVRDMLTWLAGEGAGAEEQGTSEASQGGPRLDAIRAAAYLPLAAISPSPESFRAALARSDGGHAHSLAGAVGDSPWLRILGGYGLYVRTAAALTFPAEAGAEALRDASMPFALREPITARLTVLVPCTVPIARTLFCESLVDRIFPGKQIRDIERAIRDGALWDVIDGLERARDHVRDGAREVRTLMDELGHAEIPRLALAYALLSGERFHVLRREATLPNQGAPYLYPSELEDSHE